MAKGLARGNGLGQRLTALALLVAGLGDTSRRWYREASTLISFSALLLSLITFGYTSYMEINKDKEQKRDHLRSALTQLTSQLNSLSFQSFDVLAKYKDDPSMMAAAAGRFQSQSNLLGATAYT